MDSSMFGTESISKIIIKIAPPVMLANLIQALYNIVDSLFVGNYSTSGLTALSIIFPIQLLMIALGVGTGVGINTSMSYSLGLGQEKKALKTAGVGTFLALIMWLIVAVISYTFMPLYARMSTTTTEVINDIIVYGRIVTVFSFGLFLESIWTKVCQANGNMKTPMYAQVFGALTNIILDPILIFGLFGAPEMGIAGAAIATVAGQILAALIVMKKGFKKSPSINEYKNEIKTIYRLGIPSILMQSAYTVYILGLNLILVTFSDQAVTALGVYYKWQTFFIIPMNALQTCIVPIIGYNFSARNLDRCKKTFNITILYTCLMMIIGIICFEFFPSYLLSAFTKDKEVIRIGITAFRFIGLSFIPIVTSLTYPVFFQAVGEAVKSTSLTVLRTVICFVPLAFIFSRFGLDYFWLTFPVTEIITSIAGFILYRKFFEQETLKDLR